jgi:hypothetical protein
VNGLDKRLASVLARSWLLLILRDLAAIVFGVLLVFLAFKARRFTETVVQS